LGEQKDIFLELKSLAQVGLVGFPNVGKSSILASVSRALPRIDNYPFTTLVPSIGKVNFIDNFNFTMADIPGIVEGAKDDKGLGLEFLRHIERTSILCYVLDVNENLIDNLEILQSELEGYKEGFT
jgi:GTPase